MLDLYDTKCGRPGGNNFYKSVLQFFSLKIIFSLHHFLPTSIGGTEIYTLRLAQQLQLLGVETLVVVPNFNNSATNEYFFEGIKIIRYDENTSSSRSVIMGKKAPDGLLKFAEILINEKPDLIHFHEIAAGRGISLFHAQKAKALNIPVILTCHLANYTCLTGSLIYKDIEKCDGIINIKKCTECVFYAKGLNNASGKLIRKTAVLFYNLNLNTTVFDNGLGTALGFPFVIKKIQTDLMILAEVTSKIVVLTNWYKNILQKNGVPINKLIHIKQGLTTNIPVETANSIVKHPVKIVFIGRISEVKGVHLLIDAISKIDCSTISLYIYGPETSNEYVRVCKQKSSSLPNIHWMGVIRSRDVTAELSKYHVLCLPSIFSEMSPLVIQEAFAAGLPVLASNVYGNAEQIKEGVNGWLFNFKNSDHLSEKLKALADDFYLIEQARLNLPTTRSFKNIAIEHYKLYVDVLMPNPEQG